MVSISFIKSSSPVQQTWSKRWDNGGCRGQYMIIRPLRKRSSDSVSWPVCSNLSEWSWPLHSSVINWIGFSLFLLLYLFLQSNNSTIILLRIGPLIHIIIFPDSKWKFLNFRLMGVEQKKHFEDSSLCSGETAMTLFFSPFLTLKRINDKSWKPLED